MDIVSIIVPVFFIPVIGYLLTWVGVFRPRDVDGLTRYVFAAAAVLGRVAFHQSRHARAAFAMGASYSKTVPIGFSETPFFLQSLRWYPRACYSHYLACDLV